MKRIPKFLTAYDTLPTVSSEESKGLPELMLVDTGEKRNITFKDNSPFRAYFTGTDTYLPMAPWADTADTYAYSHDGSIYRVPKQGFEPSTDDLNAHQRYEKALNNTTVKDLDKLMLAYLGLGTAPITLPAATSNVLMPMVMNPVSTALGIGGYELGSRGFDNVMQRYTGKNWSEYMKDKYNMPEWASGLINPAGILTGGVGSLAGRMYELLGKNALKQGASALGREALSASTVRPATIYSDETIPTSAEGFPTTRYLSNGKKQYQQPPISSTRYKLSANVMSDDGGGGDVIAFEDGTVVPKGFIPKRTVELTRNGKRGVFHLVQEKSTGKFRILEDLDLNPNYGYDRKVIANQAREEFGDEVRRPLITREANENEVLADALSKTMDGTSETRFATGNGTLTAPGPHEVVTGTYWDLLTGKPVVRGGGYIGTKPVDVTATEGTYRSSGKYGNMVSATDSLEAGGKYGYRDLEEISNYISGLNLNTAETKYILDLISRMKGYLRDNAIVFKEGADTTLGAIKKSIRDKNPEAFLQYLKDENELSKWMMGDMRFGAKNQNIVFIAPKEQRIITGVSEDPGFASRQADIKMPLTDFRGKRFRYHLINKPYKNTWPNGLIAEEKIAKYNSDPEILKIILNGMNNPDVVFPLHFRATAPNPTPGMTTMQVFGVRPTFKRGGRIKVTNHKKIIR